MPFWNFFLKHFASGNPLADCWLKGISWKVSSERLVTAFVEGDVSVLRGNPNIRGLQEGEKATLR